MNKFKVGQRVKRINNKSKGLSQESQIGWIGTVVPDYMLSGNADYEDERVTVRWNNGAITFPFMMCLAKFSLKFLLQYERDEDPIEEFQTLPEARKRIKELTKDSEVKQDSFVIYRIADVYDVEITKQVELKIRRNKKTL